MVSFQYCLSDNAIYGPGIRWCSIPVVSRETWIQGPDMSSYGVLQLPLHGLTYGAHFGALLRLALQANTCSRSVHSFWALVQSVCMTG